MVEIDSRLIRCNSHTVLPSAIRMYITDPAELWALEITKSSRTEIVNSPIANCKEGVITGEGGTFP